MATSTASSGDEGEFAHLVMNLSLRKYSTLPRKGKPKKGEEWTPLATILCHQGILSVDMIPYHNIVKGGQVN